MRKSLIFANPGFPARILAVAFLFTCILRTIADVLPADRRIDWAPGVRGGIPVRTNIINVRNPPYNAVGNGIADDAAAIQAAINAAAPGQVVFLPEGTYHVTSELDITSSGITLRGAGMNKSIIKNDSGGAYTLLKIYHPSAISSGAPVTAGSTKGSTNITLSSTAGVNVGDYLAITHLNPSFVSFFNCGYCGEDDPSRSMSQMNRVVGKAGNSLTLERPLYFDFVNSPIVKQLVLNTGVGVEDLTLWRANPGAVSGYNMHFYSIGNSWVKNVSSTNAGNRHIELERTYAITMRDSVFWDGFNHGSDHSYGIRCFGWGSDHLVENNIFYRLRHSMIFEGGGSGIVFGYNYSIGVFTSDGDDPHWLSEDLDTHGAHPFMNLYEGNIAAVIVHDFTHGSASHNTTFRCRLINESISTLKPTLARYGVNVMQANYSNNIIGCVIGSSGDTGVRFQPNGGGGQCSYRLGFSAPGSATLSDPLVAPSTLIHGNYDYIGNGILWDASNPDHNLPASLYLTKKPDWFGNRPWPPIDPGNPAGAVPTNLPAGYRWVFGTNPPLANLPPVAVANANPLSGSPPLVVSFSSAGSFDPEGSGMAFTWTFGDGASTNSPNPTHTYAAPGTYNALLSVSDGLNTSAAGVAITVTLAGNAPPVANASANLTNGVAPMDVAFSSAGSYDPEGAGLTFSWTFGDGDTSTTPNPVHTYRASGTYLARLTVSDGVNTSLGSVVTLRAVPAPPSDAQTVGQ